VDVLVERLVAWHAVRGAGVLREGLLGVHEVDAVAGLVAGLFADDLVQAAIRAELEGVQVAGQGIVFGGFLQLAQRLQGPGEAEVQFGVAVVERQGGPVGVGRGAGVAFVIGGDGLGEECRSPAHVGRTEIGAVQRSQRRAVVQVDADGAK
jgi:hypothetical protein